jgi:hypothetical protein
MINAATLGDALRLGEVADEELTGIFGTVFPLARWESNDRVNYFHSEQGHVLDVVYSKRGQILRFEPRPGLTDELVAELREHVDAAFVQDAGVEIRRGLLFGMPPVNGFWRHGDDWQILPAPPQAPRPRALMGDHPFVLEYRVRSSSAFSVALMRRSRRYWEQHLLLSLLLRGRITRETFEPQHHWVILPEPMPNGLQTAYVNEGYLVGEGFLLVADDFSDPSEHPQLAVVPDDDYYARRGVSRDEMDVPACLDVFFDRFDAADTRTRDQLLRASYWLDAAYRVWHVSKSLSFIATINAVEVLIPEAEEDRCPMCGRDRSPGPTARFHDFVETYAADEGAEERKALYRLRSAFVHGGALHNLDIPRPWGGMEPHALRHYELHDIALKVSRSAIRTWFLSQPAMEPPAPEEPASE